MDSVRRVLVYGKENVKVYFLSLKTVCVCLGILFLIVLSLKPLEAYAIRSGESIGIFELFSQYTNGMKTQILLLGGFWILIGDAPFINESTTYLYIRGKKWEYLLGQTCYLAFLSLFYTCIIWFGTLISTINALSFRMDWSKAVVTGARSSWAVGFPFDVGFSDFIIRNASPIEAFFRAFFGLFLLYFFLGTMLCVLNLLTDSMLGNFGFGILVAMDFFLSGIYGNSKFAYIQPITMIRVGAQNLGKSPYSPNFLYVVFFMLTGSFLFLAAGYCKLKRRG